MVTLERKGASDSDKLILKPDVHTWHVKHVKVLLLNLMSYTFGKLIVWITEIISQLSRPEWCSSLSETGKRSRWNDIMNVMYCVSLLLTKLSHARLDSFLIAPNKNTTCYIALINFIQCFLWLFLVSFITSVTHEYSNTHSSSGDLKVSWLLQ